MNSNQKRIKKIYSTSKLKEPYYSMSLLKRYWIYQWERLPLIPLILMTLSICWAVSQASGVLNWYNLFFCTTMLTAYLLQIRFADEPKDFEHDNKYYPTRPVQRGVITLSELLKLRNISISIFFVSAICLWSIPVLILAIIQQYYSYLTRVEFFAREWLRKHFLLYMFSHYFQLVILSMLAITSLLVPKSDILFSLGFVLSLLAMVELSRKVQESSNDKAKDTYSANIGRGKAISFLLLITSLASYLTLSEINYDSLLSPAPLIVGISFVLIAVYSGRYLREPNKNNTKLLQFGSLMHYFVCCWVLIIGA